MIARTFVLVFCLAFGPAALGILPTISCENQTGSLVFEEAVDDFTLDIKAGPSSSALIEGVLGNKDMSLYLLQLRVPKTPPRPLKQVPICSFAIDDPQIFQCMLTNSTGGKVSGKLTHLQSGREIGLNIGFFHFLSETASVRSLSLNKVGTHEVFRFQTILGLFAPSATASGWMNFSRSDCKLGELDTSPAR